MGPTENISRSRNIEGLSDRELIEQFCPHRRDTDIAHELWRRYGEILQEAVRKHASALRPRGYDHKSFVDSCLTRAYINFLRRICGYRFEGKFEAWLVSVAYTAALDERRVIMRGGKGVVPLGDVLPDEVAEEQSEEEPRPFRSNCGTAGLYGRAQKVPPPDAEIKADERKYVFREAITRYADAEEAVESAIALRLYHWRNWNKTRIAKRMYGEPNTERELNTCVQRVRRKLEHDHEELKQLLEKDFGITGPQHV